MICPKCGADNTEGSSFCIKCGANLKEIPETLDTNEISTQNEQNTNVQPPIENATPNIEPQQPIYTTPANNVNASAVPFNYLMYIISIILKPFQSFKENKEELNNTQTSLVFALIVAGSMTVVNLIRTIISTVHRTSWSGRSSWDWSYIKNIDWLQAIGKNFLIYACVIFAIAAVFYLGSLIIKKELNFIRALSISTTAVIPTVVGTMILSPLAGMIWSYLSMAFSFVGVIYSFIILYELMNDELKLEGDIKIYFNAACLGALAIAGYYSYIKLIVSSLRW